MTLAAPVLEPRTPQPAGPGARRWRRFKRHRRAWLALRLLALAYAASLAAPLVINDRALLVRYEGELYAPILHGFYQARTFGQRAIGEADYRALASELGAERCAGWVLMPPYPYDPNESLLTDPALPGPPPHPPSLRHWFGTDDRARDVFARVVYGFRTSMTFGLAVVALAYALGILVGAVLGFFAGRIDFYGQRLVEIWSGMPFLYTVIIVSALVRPTAYLLAPLLAAFSWVGISRYVRGEFYREKSKDYVLAATAAGQAPLAIALRHVLANALVPVLSFAPFSLVAAIVSLVSLDYLGFGLPPPTPSWGEQLEQGLTNIRAWHLVLFPMGSLFATLLLVVLVGEGVRQAFDPRAERSAASGS